MPVPPGPLAGPSSLRPRSAEGSPGQASPTHQPSSLSVAANIAAGAGHLGRALRSTVSRSGSGRILPAEDLSTAVRLSHSGTGSTGQLRGSTSGSMLEPSSSAPAPGSVPEGGHHTGIPSRLSQPSSQPQPLRAAHPPARAQLQPQVGRPFC
jgi:hypothetical protein